MQVSVNESHCQATGFCQRVAPELFRVDGPVATVLQPTVPPELEDAAREAEDLCPMNAIVAKD